LGPGEHTVRLEKSSETQDKTAKFDGFFVPSPDLALPPPHYDRRIEFIGDSYTVGYGDQSRGQTCTVQDVYDTTDTSAAFAPMIAKRLGAAYRINAFSGRGVVRNYDGIVPGVTLPVLYPYALFDRSVKADDSGWIPDVVVIGLGTNDFSTPLNPGEKWATREAEHTDFVNTYVKFVKSLHARWPAAHIILMASTSYEDEIEEEVNATSQRLHEDGLDVEVIVFAGLDWQACHAHPSLKDETVLSQLLYESISRLPKFAGAAP
jgi:lysophospholipase L1-like esterase